MSESSNRYLDKVVVIDGAQYNNTAVHADNSSKIAPVAGEKIPNSGDKDEGNYTGVYVVKGASGNTSSRTDLETLVTRCSAMTMYDPEADEFIRVQAAKLAILNQLDIFSTNTFSVAWPGMNLPVKYTFDEGATWSEWIAKNSSTGFTLLDTETNINQNIIPKNTVVVQISQTGVETTFYVIATIKDGVYSFISGEDLISKTDSYFFLVPGYPANVTDIKATSGSDGSGSCKIDLSFTCVQGAIKTQQVAIGVSINSYPTWTQIEDANGGSTTSLTSWKFIDIADGVDTITTSFTGLAECTHYISIFPIATGEIINKNAENSDVNRITLETFSIIFLDPPTVRETNNNGDLLQYYGGNRYLKNFLSTVVTPDGYALTYGSDSAADIQIEGGVATVADDYTATLTLLNPLYRWSTTKTATCSIDWTIARMHKAFVAQFISPTVNSNTGIDLPTTGVHDCGYAQSIWFEVRPYTGLDIDKLPITEDCISVSFSGTPSPTYKKVRKVQGGGFVFEIQIDPFVGTATGTFNIAVPVDLARNFAERELSQGFKIKGQVDAFEDNSWAAIFAAASAGKIPSTWKVGDYKEITLAKGNMGGLAVPATTLNAMIVNKTDTCLTFCFATSGNAPKPIAFTDSSFAGTNSYGGAFESSASAVLNMDTEDSTNAKVNGYKTRLKWALCGMRTAILGSNAGAASRSNTLYSLLPQDLKDVLCIAKITSYGAEYNTTTKKLGSAAAFESYDVLPLLSPSDLGLKTDECKTVNTLAYFQNATKRKFYRYNSSNTVCDIHLRDVWPYLGGTANTSLCNHSKSSEHCTFYAYQDDYILKAYQDRSRGVAPIFFIGKRDGTASNGVKVINNYK